VRSELIYYTPKERVYGYAGKLPAIFKCTHKFTHLFLRYLSTAEKIQTKLISRNWKIHQINHSNLLNYILELMSIVLKNRQLKLIQFTNESKIAIAN